MSLELKLVSVGPPLPSTKRGYNVQIDVHKDGDTVAYGNGKFVITRSLTQGGKAEVYTEHKNDVKVARFNKSGYFVASADSMGIVRVWSYDHPDKLLKKETKHLASCTDLCWDGDGKRVAISGDGPTKGALFSYDTGASLDKGQIMGCSRNCASLALKPNRPYRLVIGDEDGTLCFFKGPPIVLLERDLAAHTNVIQCIRYSKDGSKFATCSNDKKIHVYDGKDGKKLSTMKSGKKSRHNASVYGLAFNEDGTQIFTASSDKTCRLWDVESGKRVATFNAAGAAKPQIRHQQLACAYTKHGPLSVALSGELTIYDVDKADEPIKTVIVGHQSPLATLAYDSDSDTLATGCRKGLVCIWKDGFARRFSGDAVSNDSTIVHKAGVKGLCFNKGALFTLGSDGVLNTLDVTSGKVANSQGIGGEGVCLAYARNKPGTFVFGSISKKLTLVVGGKTAGSADLSDDPIAVAISDDGTEILVSTDDSCVHFLSASDLTVKHTTKLLGRKVVAAAFAPDGLSYAVATSGNYMISTYKLEDHSQLVSGYWTHSANVVTLAFSPDGKYLVSGGLDGNISFWTPADKHFKLVTKAHFQGVLKVVFTKSGLASIGADNCLKTWELGAPAPAAASAGS